MPIPPHLIDESPTPNYGPRRRMTAATGNPPRDAQRPPKTMTTTKTTTKTRTTAPWGRGGGISLEAIRPSGGSESHSLAIAAIDRHVRMCAAGAVCLYAALVAASYAAVPPEDVARLVGAERNAALAASVAIAASLGGHVIPALGGLSLAPSFSCWGGGGGGDTMAVAAVGGGGLWATRAGY